MDKGKEWRPGDVFGRIWPSDELRNLSADGREIADQAMQAFREALSPKETTRD
jgi:hypothetical protein